MSHGMSVNARCPIKTKKRRLNNWIIDPSHRSWSSDGRYKVGIKKQGGKIGRCTDLGPPRKTLHAAMTAAQTECDERNKENL